MPFTNPTLPVFDQSGYLLCPWCKEPTIEDMGDILVFPDLDGYDSPAGTRGGYIRADLSCCCGAQLSLFTGNHKGAHQVTLMEWTNTTRREDLQEKAQRAAFKEAEYERKLKRIAESA